MSTEIQKFDYTALDQDTQAFLRDRARQIHNLARTTAQGIVQIGGYLTEAKARAGHGQFLKWIEGEFAWKERMARNFMMVYERFKTANFADMDIDVSALYLIAAPKTPEPVRQEVLERAANGNRVTHAEVRELLEERERLRVERAKIPSPAAARQEAIRTGMHVADRRGVYQPPITKMEEAEIRVDRDRIEPVDHFLTWFAESNPITPAQLLRIIGTRHWERRYLTDPSAIHKSAKWFADLSERVKAR